MTPHELWRSQFPCVPAGDCELRYRGQGHALRGQAPRLRAAHVRSMSSKRARGAAEVTLPLPGPQEGLTGQGVLAPARQRHSDVGLQDTQLPRRDGQLAEHIQSKISQPGRVVFVIFMSSDSILDCAVYILDPVISNSSSQQDDLLCSSWLRRSSHHPTSPPLPHQPSPPYAPRGACFLASHFHAQRLQQQRPHHPLHTGWAVPGCPPPFTNHLANSSPRQEGQQQRHLYLGHPH